MTALVSRLRFLLCRKQSTATSSTTSTPTTGRHSVQVGQLELALDGIMICSVAISRRTTSSISGSNKCDPTEILLAVKHYTMVQSITNYASSRATLFCWNILSPILTVQSVQFRSLCFQQFAEFSDASQPPVLWYWFKQPVGWYQSPTPSHATDESKFQTFSSYYFYGNRRLWVYSWVDVNTSYSHDHQLLLLSECHSVVDTGKFWVSEIISLFQKTWWSMIVNI